MNGNCPECGSNAYQRRTFGRDGMRLLRLNQEMERANAARAVAEAKLRMAALDHKDEMAWLQSKVARQSDTINRLEDRVRALGGQPYGSITESGQTGSQTRDTGRSGS